MKRLTYSTPAKATTIVFSCLIFAFIVFLCMVIFIGALAGMYTEPKGAVLQNALEDGLNNITHQIIYDFVYERNLEYYNDTNIFYSITDRYGNAVASNYSGADLEFKTTENFKKLEGGGYYYGDGEYIDQDYSFEKYTIAAGINTLYPQKDYIWLINKGVDIAYSLRYSAIFLIALCVFVLIFLLIFLFCSAGHRSDSGSVSLNSVDKVPFDIFALFFVIIALIEISFMASVYSGEEIIVIIGALLLVFDFPLVLWLFLSMATRIKVGGIFKSMVIYKMSSFIIKSVIKAIKKTMAFARNIPIVFNTAIWIFAVSFAEFFIIVNFSHRSAEAIIIFWFISKIITVPLVLYAAMCFKRLKNASEKIAHGDLNYTVSVLDMQGDFRRMGEALNNISDGMQAAVDEKLKSERFKTELITNVSHDIKTPLTSIINYVDLIKKEEITNEKVSEYVSVLDRQSVRLKKLIEDLIEASKASTGNLTLNMQPCSVEVLLSQAVGEYHEKFEENNLEIVITKPKTSAMVLADGRHLWRVFDNLLNNVCKYAQNNTRVYLSTEVLDGKVVTVIKNISKTQLNISGDELMERFVRGDSSRNTEGSGLGLSIAKSLVGLQNGQLKLSVDGDLFKVIVIFDVYGN